MSADTIVPGGGSLTVAPNDATATAAWGQRGPAANPQLLNRYTYVSNNPIMNTDPTGHLDGDDGTSKPLDMPGGGGPATTGSVAAAKSLVDYAMNNPNIRSAVVNAVGNGAVSVIVNIPVLEKGIGAYAKAVGSSMLEGALGGLASGSIGNGTTRAIVGSGIATLTNATINGGPDAGNFGSNLLAENIVLISNPGTTLAGEIGVSAGVNALVAVGIGVATDIGRRWNKANEPSRSPPNLFDGQVPTFVPTRAPR